MAGKISLLAWQRFLVVKEVPGVDSGIAPGGMSERELLLGFS